MLGVLQEYELTTRTTQETFLLGESLSAILFPSLVLSLSGDLGAGKTVLTRGIVQGLGGKHVRSPSFTLINEYPTTPPIAHVDLYRLAASETDSLGLEEYVENGYLLIVEWADRLQDPPGAEHLYIRISYGDLSTQESAIVAPYDMERKIALSATGTKASEALKKFKTLWSEKMERGSQ